MRQSFLLVLPLMALLACGGGGSPAPTPAPSAPKITYTDPASSGYRLVRNATLSSDSHLVLDLVGPSGVQGRGVAFTFAVDPARLAWAKPEATDADLVRPMTFDLGAAPQILKAKQAAGTLQVAFAQKGSAVPAKTLDAVLARVALDRVASAPTSPTLTTSACQVLPAAGTPQDISVAVGTLRLQ